MFMTCQQLRFRIAAEIAARGREGHITEGLASRLDALPDSHDALLKFAGELASLPLRTDWSYVEPVGWPEIQAHFDPARPCGTMGSISLSETARKLETAFLARVCGCILGKPLEVKPTLAEIRAAAGTDWPLSDYIRPELLDALGRRHWSWTNTTRGRIAFVEPDDDLNYAILAMLLLEQHGTALSTIHIRDAWLLHIPFGTTFGPERAMLARAGTNYLFEKQECCEEDPSAWASFLNPGAELCGAQIRADAYGYACPGNPSLAAELAWRDASWTHRKTGVYAAMWTAAAIAAAPVVQSPLEIFETANCFVPQKSRFHETMAWALETVRTSSGWLDAYEKLRLRLGEYGHCQIYFESATLINTLHYAQDIGDGICKQVMQGNDTDSYGATAGSLLGAYFGPEKLESRWVSPFRDDIHTGLAWFFERSLSKVASRMGALGFLHRPFTCEATGSGNENA